MVDGRVDRYSRAADESWSDRRALAAAARDATGPFIAGLCEWDYFATATYDPRKVRGSRETILGVEVAPKVSPWKSRRDSERYLTNVERALRRPVAGVFVCEPHKSGVYHVHGLLGLGGASDEDFRVLQRSWYGPHGHIRLERPRSKADVAEYCGKYLAKDFGELVLSRSLVRQASMLAGRAPGRHGRRR